jgi:hypothetical protein
LWVCVNLAVALPGLQGLLKGLPVYFRASLPGPWERWARPQYVGISHLQYKKSCLAQIVSDFCESRTTTKGPDFNWLERRKVRTKSQRGSGASRPKEGQCFPPGDLVVLPHAIESQSLQSLPSQLTVFSESTP